MSMTLKIAAESDFLRVSAMGEFSLVEAKRTFIEMLEAVAQNKVEKVLFDGRGLVGNPNVMERFYYSEFAHSRSLNSQIAVCPVPHYLRTFLKSQCVTPRGSAKPSQWNRGMFVKTFDNLDDALGWLGIAPANNPNAGDGK